MSDKYIIVRVTEKDRDASSVRRIRRAIHDTVEHYGLDVADVVLTGEPSRYSSAQSGGDTQAKEDWAAVDTLFSRIADRVKGLVGSWRETR